MCGIVGYIGDENATPILLEGLRRLEYRGYDSAGIAVRGNGVQVVKEKGRIDNLQACVDKKKSAGHNGYRSHPLGNSRRAV